MGLGNYAILNPTVLFKGIETADKPGSVVNNHSSGTHIAMRLKQPTRERCGPHLFACANCSPIWSCSKWGLPCRACYQPRGALLPHHFTLTSNAGGLFSAALSVGSRLPEVIWHFALWSPDFPQRAYACCDCLAVSMRLF